MVNRMLFINFEKQNIFLLSEKFTDMYTYAYKKYIHNIYAYIGNIISKEVLNYDWHYR